MLAYALLVYVSFFTMANPIGVVPVFLAMTAGLTEEASRRIARRATLTGFVALMVFALTGRLIFDFFGISVDALRVVGGIIFFGVGFQMLNARLVRETPAEEVDHDAEIDIAITPLGIPIITGPGAITTAILLMNDGTDLGRHLIVLGMLALVMLTTYVILIGGRRIMTFLGKSAATVFMRLMGLIVMVIAVEFFFAGVTPYVRTMLAGS